MGCLVAILAGFFPRFALVVVWIATDKVDRAFDSFILPLLGLFFLPLTTLVYALAWVPGVDLGNGRWLWVALAFVFELAGYVGTGRTNRDRLGSRD
jgi:hypothetical protein